MPVLRYRTLTPEARGVTGLAGALIADAMRNHDDVHIVVHPNHVNVTSSWLGGGRVRRMD